MGSRASLSSSDHSGTRTISGRDLAVVEDKNYAYVGSDASAENKRTTYDGIYFEEPEAVPAFEDSKSAFKNLREWLERRKLHQIVEHEEESCPKRRRNNRDLWAEAIRETAPKNARVTAGVCGPAGRHTHALRFGTHAIFRLNPLRDFAPSARSSKTQLPNRNSARPSTARVQEGGVECRGVSHARCCEVR